MTQDIQRLTKEAMLQQRRLMGVSTIGPTVDFMSAAHQGYQDRVKEILGQKQTIEDTLGTRMLAEMVVRPMLTAFSILQMLSSVRQVLVSSKLSISRKASDSIKRAAEQLDKDFRGYREQYGVQMDYLLEYLHLWYSNYGIKEISTWRNVYSQELLKTNLCGSNDNLRDLVSYVLVARDLSEEYANERNRMMRIADEKLKSEGKKVTIVAWNDCLFNFVTEAASELRQCLHIPDIRPRKHIDNCIANWRHYIDHIYSDTVMVDD